VVASLISQPPNPPTSLKTLKLPKPLGNNRWVELVVRMLEDSVRKGVTEGVAAIAKQVAWHARSAMQRPLLEFEPWSLEEAAAAVTPAQMPTEEVRRGALRGRVHT
jgi:hypothetical protein